MNAVPGSGAPRLQELDSLRGIAALMVLLFHYTTKYEQDFGHTRTLILDAPWGQYGVQLFFGISGFVIFWTLRRTAKPADFLVSRFSRLFPAYWVAIAITTLAVVLGDLRTLDTPWAATLAYLFMAHGLCKRSTIHSLSAR